MSNVDILNVKETEELLTALRHRFVKSCQLHLNYETKMNKSLEEGDDNMAAYWQYLANREWERGTSIRNVINDIIEDLSSYNYQ